MLVVVFAVYSIQVKPILNFSIYNILQFTFIKVPSIKYSSLDNRPKECLGLCLGMHKEWFS